MACSARGEKTYNRCRTSVNDAIGYLVFFFEAARLLGCSEGHVILKILR